MQGKRAIGFGFLLALAAFACGGGGQPVLPNLSATSPLDAATGVPVNAKLSAAFDMAMDPLTAATFTLNQGTTPVAGTVATSPDGTIATFTPSSNLAASSTFTATIAAAARSAAGATLGSDRTWTFTTGTGADSSAPVVSATNPAADASGIAINARISATFSKAMDPFSLTASTFVVLAKSAISTVAPSAVTGDIGLSPAAP